MKKNISDKIDWQEIEHVFFDMDGTLLDLHFDSYFWMESVPAEYAKKNNLKDTEVFRKEMYRLIMSKKGTLEWYCLDFWEEKLNLDIMKLKNDISEKIQMLPYAKLFLDFLKYQKKEVWLTTNSHRKGVDLKFDKIGFKNYFTHVVSSHDYGHPKESLEFWNCLQQQHSFNPKKVIFFDDAASVIKSAEEYGIKYPVLMLKPDSQKAANPYNEKYLCIKSFSELMD